jgi:hypothetical protein
VTHSFKTVEKMGWLYVRKCDWERVTYWMQTCDAKSGKTERSFCFATAESLDWHAQLFSIQVTELGTCSVTS